MKKLMLLAMFLIPITSFANPGEHHRDREHHEWHERGGHFGWGEFVGGLVLGGIIAHEVNGHYYDNNEEEVRRIRVCNDSPVVDRDGRYVYDQWGHMVIERRCHDEWIRDN
jgi:hypothetical protein